MLCDPFTKINESGNDKVNLEVKKKAHPTHYPITFNVLTTFNKSVPNHTMGGRWYY